jgi:hypothetical protein
LDRLRHLSSWISPERTFITADVGKLYLVTSRSVGRATEH